MHLFFLYCIFDSFAAIFFLEIEKKKKKSGEQVSKKPNKKDEKSILKAMRTIFWDKLAFFFFIWPNIK